MRAALDTRRMRVAVAATLGAATAVLARPDIARACAVCFGGENNDWTGGFLFGTIVMLALPPAILISASVAIYRAMKRQEARLRERDAQRALQPGTR
jgi:hypothetical protein